MLVHTFLYIYQNIYVYIYICIVRWIWVCTSICAFISICVYIYNKLLAPVQRSRSRSRSSLRSKATNFKIIGNKNPPSAPSARIMHRKILIFNICFECACLAFVWLEKYLKMNYINMDALAFKWSQNWHLSAPPPPQVIWLFLIRISPQGVLLTPQYGPDD